VSILLNNIICLCWECHNNMNQSICLLCVLMESVCNMPPLLQSSRTTCCCMANSESEITECSQAAKCNCNWGSCIALPTRRPRAHHRVNPYPGARRQNETEMFSDHDETSPSIAAVLAPSVDCSMLAVQQQKRLCRQVVDVSAAVKLS